MARNVTTSTGSCFLARALTRGEIKALRKAGVDIFLSAGEDNLGERVDAVLDIVFPSDNAALDALPFPEVMKVFTAIVNETSGNEEEVKNS